MKQAIAGIGILCGIVPICAQTKATKPFVMPPAVRRPDFRQVWWGMSYAGVRSAESSGVNAQVVQRSPSEKLLNYDDRIAEMDCNILYVFVTDKLVQADYIITEKHSNENRYIEDFDRLKKILVEKYGGSSDRDVWSSDLYRDDPTHYGIAVSDGHLSKAARWHTVSTIVTLMLFGDNGKITLSIDYESVEYGPLRAEQDKNKQRSVF